MFKKITTLALAAAMVLSMGATAFAAPTSQGDRDPGRMQEVKQNLDEKGITLQEAQSNFASMLENFAAEKGITVEEAQAGIAAMKENGHSLEGLKNLKDELELKGITLEDAKANFASMLEAMAAEKGITVEEAKAIIAEIKANGHTLEGIKNFRDNGNSSIAQ